MSAIGSKPATRPKEMLQRCSSSSPRGPPTRSCSCASLPAAIQASESKYAPQPTRRALILLLPASTTTAALGGMLAWPAPTIAKQVSSAGDWSSPGLAAPLNDDAPRFFAAEGGVKVQVLAEGSGPEAKLGDRVLVDYVLRRSNGYFIYGTVEGVSFQPKNVPVGPVALQLGDGSVVPGLESALLGMKPGGKRRMLVPPEVGYGASPSSQPAMPTFATQRQLENHKEEPLLFEVQMLRVGDRKQ